MTRVIPMYLASNGVAFPASWGVDDNTGALYPDVSGYVPWAGANYALELPDGRRLLVNSVKRADEGYSAARLA